MVQFFSEKEDRWSCSQCSTTLVPRTTRSESRTMKSRIQSNLIFKSYRFVWWDNVYPPITFSIRNLDLWNGKKYDDTAAKCVTIKSWEKIGKFSKWKLTEAMEFLVQFYFNEKYFTANTQACRLKNVIQFGNLKHFYF